MPLEIIGIWNVVQPLREYQQLAAVMRVIFVAVAEILFDPLAELYGEVFIDSDVSPVEKGVVIPAQQDSIAYRMWYVCLNRLSASIAVNPFFKKITVLN